MKLQDRFRESRVCQLCGAPAERRGTAGFQPRGDDVWFSFSPLPDHVVAHRVPDGTPDATHMPGPKLYVLARGVRKKKTGEPYDALVYAYCCTSHECGFVLTHEQTTKKELPDWCHEGPAVKRPDLPAKIEGVTASVTSDSGGGPRDSEDGRGDVRREDTQGRENILF